MPIHTGLLEDYITCIEIGPHEDYFTCFSFKNCPNLDKDARDAIYAYVNCCNEREEAIWRKCQEREVAEAPETIPMLAY